MPHVAVLMGGPSAERAVSLNTGAQVSSALESLGYRVTGLDTGDPAFISTLNAVDPDVAFICLHGRFGEDGTMQGLLEILGVSYVGSGVLASALAMDKAVSKAIFEHAGIPTPVSVTLRRGSPYDIADIVSEVGARSVVKPVNEGSAIGVSIVHSIGELGAAIDEAFRYDEVVLVERFIEGVEVTVGVLGDDEPFALPTLEIVPEHEFYDYDSKYVPGMSQHIIPARISPEADEACRMLSLEAHRILGCRDMSRTDTIVTEDDGVFVLEINTIPGMTATSLLPDAARAAGIEFPDLCARLVGWARARGPRRIG